MDLRNIDVLIAANVMRFGYQSYEPQATCSECEGDTANCEVPRYSSDIAAAWEVVEKLRETFAIVEVTVGHYELSENETGKWSCCIEQGPKDNELVTHWNADTAPLAICLAALKAVGVEVPA